MSESNGKEFDAILMRVSGGMFTHRDLTKGEELHLHVTDSEGEPVADGYGTVLATTDKDIRDKKTGDVDRTERIHSVRMT